MTAVAIRSKMGRPFTAWDPFELDERALIRDHLHWMQLRNLRPRYLEARLGVLSRARRAVGVPLLEATPALLGEHLDSRAREIGADTRGVDISHIRGFYRWAITEELIDRDPTLRLARPRHRRRLPRPMPDEDFRKAMDLAPPVVRSILALAAYAGLRRTEIALLEREDVVDGAAQPVLRVRDGKGGRQRIVPLADKVVVTLRADGLLDHDGPVFRLVDGSGPMGLSRVGQLANRYLKSIGVSHTLHTLRHWFGTNMYQGTHDLRLVQELMGHASPTTTAGYAAWDPAGGARAVNALG